MLHTIKWYQKKLTILVAYIDNEWPDYDSKLRFQIARASSLAKLPRTYGFRGCHPPTQIHEKTCLALIKILLSDKFIENLSLPAIREIKKIRTEILQDQNPTTDGAYTQALNVLHEFIEDVKLAYGTGKGNQIDAMTMDWPDLEKTYEKALAVVGLEAPDKVHPPKRRKASCYIRNS